MARRRPPVRPRSSPSARTGKYLLSAHYQGAYAAAHPLGRDGAVSGPALDRQDTVRST
jgi:hypothetical protein